MPMAVVMTSSASEMKKIFDLCDKNGDGLINREDFKNIGGEHFDGEQVEKLLELMDPCNTGGISFIMFCRGVETFLMEMDSLQRSESGASTLSCSSSGYINDHSGSTSELTSDRDGEEVISSDDIYPVESPPSAMSNGYTHTSGNSVGIEIAIDSPNERPLNNTLHTLLRSSSSSPGVTKDSPTLIAKHLLMTRRQQQHMNQDSPSQSSTPAEMAEDEVNKLSDELSELSGRLQELESEQKDKEGYTARLKKENKDLKLRLEEYEEMLRVSEQNQEKIAKESEARLKNTTRMLRVQSEQSLTELNSKLAVVVEEENRHKDREVSLKIQMGHLEEKLELKDGEIETMRDTQEDIKLELQRVRDEHRIERVKWKTEMDSLSQVLHEREEHIQQLRVECETMSQNHRETFIEASDMDGEVNKLKKLLEEARKRNIDLEAKFMQQGQALLANTEALSLSLEAELENVSKDEVLDALKKSEEQNLRLQSYLDDLLCNIMTKHPELLEIN